MLLYIAIWSISPTELLVLRLHSAGGVLISVPITLLAELTDFCIFLSG
jgi:hypothetical protein